MRERDWGLGKLKEMPFVGMAGGWLACLLACLGALSVTVSFGERSRYTVPAHRDENLWYVSFFANTHDVAMYLLVLLMLIICCFCSFETLEYYPGAWCH